MSNKTINQFSTDTNLNGGEFILIMTNNVTKNMLLSDVKTFILKDTKEIYTTGGTANNLDRTYTFTNSTGGTFTVIALSDILITGATTDDLTRSYTFTNSTGGTFTVDGLFDVYVTGGTYSDGVTTFVNSTGGTFDVTGYYTGYTAPIDVYVTGGTYSAGTLYLTNNTGYTFDITGFTTGSSSNNISDSLYTVYGGLNANVTSSATTSILSYGVNVFTGVTSTNYATKLPQPVTGKSVKVINNGSTLLAIYPSNIGGKINNLPINTPVSIPPDGKIYEFICIVNPLPGEWTFTAPATAQYDSGEMTISITAKTSSGYNPVITAYNSNYIGDTKTFNSYNYGYNGKNKYSIVGGSSAGVYYLSFRPDTPWSAISKIKVYTNLIDINGDLDTTEVRIHGSGEADYYSLFDGEIITNGASDGGTLFQFGLTNKITGSPISGSTFYTSTNIGDAGTIWGEKVANTDIYSNVSFNDTYGTFIGNKTLGNVPYPFDFPIPSGTTVELFYSSYISFQIQPFASVYDYGQIPDFKLRFIIEYF